MSCAAIAGLLGRSGAEAILLSANYAPCSRCVVISFECGPVSKRLAEARVDFRPAERLREISGLDRRGVVPDG